MKIIEGLVQGSPEWHAHRARHRNASEAAVMLGIHPSIKRTEMLDAYKSGIEREITDFQQKLFDDGHRFEALARPLAEEFIGDELYMVVGVSGCGRYSASFDGLTMDGDVAWEHKTINDAIRSAGDDAAMLPEYLRVQMEQQLLVSGAAAVLFSATRWDGELLAEKMHAWYKPDPILRERIIAGWEQFEADLMDHVPAPKVARPEGATPETLPALRVEAEGRVLASNIDAFRDHAMQVLSGINRELITDDDFADAEATVKWCKEVEDRLGAAKSNVLAQMADVDSVCRTLDDVAAETRRIRLDLDKLVKVEKENRRRAIVEGAIGSVRAHCVAINATMGEYAIPAPSTVSTIAEAIKGRRTIESITDAANTAAANLKIEASQRAERVRANIQILEAAPAHLVPDRVQLAHDKAPEDLRNLIAARVAEHERREAERLEAERERIRREEEARARAEKLAAERIRRDAEIRAQPAVTRALSALKDEAEQQHETAPRHEPPAGEQDRLFRLGDLQRAIAPLTITAAGLAELGFEPVATERASKMYSTGQIMRIATAIEDALHDGITRLFETLSTETQS